MINHTKYLFVTFCITIVLLLSLNIATAQNKTTFIIEPSTYIIDGDDLGISPGDTVLITTSAKPYLLIRNVHGTSSSPVLFKNYNGIIIFDTDHFYGISIQHSEHIIISGMDSYGYDYGIQILRVANGAGIGITDYSSDVEIKGVEIANTLISAIVSKTDPVCDENNEIHPTRDDFVQYNIVIHDNYLHDIGNEGMYIGSSFFTGYTLTCGGQQHTVEPHVNIGVQIYNNILDRTGWDGIQVSSAVNNCNIYGNIIEHDSEAEYHNQMSGIIIGGGSKCDCYNNIIKDGKGDGIEIFGKGNQKIYNNLIIRPGRTYHTGDPSFPKHGMYCGDVATDQNA
ncbi:MAG: right-handed parallel beta-helix repeat-containing protein, partial [Bacteroidota bacterium]|nr:right-handed parallel beta-helix repeat-containing protein [Bacteroidota bacterium]